MKSVSQSFKHAALTLCDFACAVGYEVQHLTGVTFMKNRRGVSTFDDMQHVLSRLTREELRYYRCGQYAAYLASGRVVRPMEYFLPSFLRPRF